MRVGVALAALVVAGCSAEAVPDTLVLGGTVFDGSGADPATTDLAILGARIVFVGDAGSEGVVATDTIEAAGLMVTPGFIDMHSHADLEADYGRSAEIFLQQGITTAVIGVDGGGTPDIAALYDRMSADGIGLNVVSYVGHGAIRSAVLGLDDRAPSETELARMRALVRKGMDEGAFGLSSGLFYVPGYYAETEEVIELARVAADYDAIYDTHDRDLGAAYQGVGYLNSIREAIRIGEESGTRVIFSHFNAQGRANYGRAPEGAALIDSARARGVDVTGAQHVYTATMSSLQAYAVPRWAAAGGPEQMVRRFTHPDTAKILDTQTMEMLEIRGGAEKILFADPRPELNGKTLAEVALEHGMTVPETVREILTDGNAWVMNLELYDLENTRFLATRPWMMTCTDGGTPLPDQDVTHPRAYGAFPRKIRLFVEESDDISMAFAVRSMSGLAADFLRLRDRGYIREGMIADLAIFDRDRIDDPATYEAPHQMARGLEHLFVNGEAAVVEGVATGALAGRPLRREGG
ncbi:MAG: amidohydrolase family protein [Gemmatimonadota bacterium]|nr:amidohydrolase family protein [Gemmatimonadota bacterium]